MEFVDYYEVMGLTPSASAEEIKRAYRKLARKYHPDVSKEEGSEARFKEIGEAYQVLKNEERRAEYDQLRTYRGSAQQGFQPPPGWQSHADVNDDAFYTGNQQPFSDFFEQLFANRARQGATHYADQGVDVRGQDMHSDLSISLKDAFQGASVTLNLLKPDLQPDGTVREVKKTLRVKIPRGVVNDQKIRVRGQGGPALGNGPTGDLYIHVKIQEHDYFHLDGKDISVNLPVAPWEAALGASVEVQTLDGPVNLNIPKNAQAGQRLRLKGRGMPGDMPGDQYVVLSIVLPEAVTDEQKEIYQTMSKLWTFNPRKKSEAQQ